MLRRILVFSTVFGLSIVVGRMTVLPASGLAVVWPAVGVGVVWLHWVRSRAELAAATSLIGGIASVGNVLTGLPPATSVLLGLANVVAAFGTWLLLGRLRRAGFGDLGETGERLSELYRFLLASAVAVAASAVVGTLAMAPAGLPADWETGVAWWLRNMTALVVVAAPAVVVRTWQAVSRAQVVEALVLFVASAAVVGWVFAPGHALPVAYVPFAFVVWAALRLPLSLAAAQGAFVALGTLLLVRVGNGGPFGAMTSDTQQILVLQGFMTMSVVLALVIGTVRAQVVESLEAEALARRGAERAGDDLRVIVETLPVGLFVIDDDGAIELQNEAATRWVHDQDVEDPQHAHLEDVVRKRGLNGEDLPLAKRPSTRALHGERVIGELVESEDAEGNERVVVVHALPLCPIEDGGGQRAVLIWDDVTDARQAVDRLSRARERADRLIADSPHGVVVLDGQGVVKQVNVALAELVGVLPEDLVGRPIADLAARGDGDVTDYVHEVVSARGAVVERDWTFARSEGGMLHLATTARFTGVGPEAEIVVNVVDISERRRYEERLSYLAGHDVLTGLPNRREFESVLAKHEAICERYGPRGSLLLIDLDHFKEVNDTFGHATGDQLIADVGGVLRAATRESDTVARIGGDEFAVLLPETDEVGAEAVAASLVEKVRDHCGALDATHRRVTASVGVVTFEAAVSHGSEAMVLADMLMYDAKDAGRDGYVLCTTAEHRRPRIGARMEWRTKIENALEQDGFEVFLQPILDVAQSRVTRAEALVRMWDGDELVPPGRFVYVAELSGLAPRLDAWVLRRSVELLSRLQEEDPEFQLEVNVSGQSIGHPDVEAALLGALEEFGVSPGTVVLEVTETAAVGDMAAAKGFAERLHAVGTDFALDDFGAGYGSFYYLKHLVFDLVKIDGEFVTNAHRSFHDRQLLSSIVDVARKLGKGTVAEFVATSDEYELVAGLGVDYAQGYFIGKPAPYSEFVTEHLRPQGTAQPVLAV
ncbi:EAL domain-containing protein [Phycicoccus sp. CSK15P-2]|uniref:bifunctional diguanylate cyclase/phosphodiesterase n=1 Tax=Phycicoccus sp. CSK15P-2 TaxID=2807627 RepID=UPI0019506EDD|nr:EAL domain-containing protein [Phycicoccus sp. CSK15P-2]MBM6405266.1 EAL domain-containing protein [Phycicoccus sp. CSK15P-2]